MRRRINITIIGYTILLLLLLTSCWQEQQHGIVPPTAPNYPVSGKVLNSADGSPVQGAIVSLYIGPDTVKVTTDSTGLYTLEHVLGGDSYPLSITKAYFESYSGSITMGYDTLEMDDITLGKIYYLIDMFNPGEWRSFSPQGVVWTGSNLWSADSMAKKIFAHNYDSFMSIAQTYKLPSYTTTKGEFFIAALGLEFHRNYVVTYDDRRNTLYELILTAGDTALIQNEYELPDDISAIGDLWDFTFDGFRLWSCCAGPYDRFHTLPVYDGDDVIYRHGGDLSILETHPVSEFDAEIVNPTGIASDGEIFWLNSRGNHRLYMLTEDLTVLGYYVYDETVWPWAPYQICWGNGYLWGSFRDSWAGINSVGGPTQYIYKFGTLYP